MSNKLYILAFVVLILMSGGIAFFVKKQLDKKQKESKITPTKATSLAPSAEVSTGAKPRELESPKQELTIESGIHVEHVDTVNRKFFYKMHYNGIAKGGTFKDGDADLLLPKSFGSFSIQQVAPEVKFLKPIAPSTKGGKMGGTSNTASKLGKIGNTVVDLSTSKPIATMKPSDLVHLTIKDQHGVLETLTVNLATGAKVGGKSPRNWDRD